MLMESEQKLSAAVLGVVHPGNAHSAWIVFDCCAFSIHMSQVWGLVDVSCVVCTGVNLQNCCRGG